VARPSWKIWFALLGVPAIVIVGALSYVAWRQSVPGVRAEISPVPRAIGSRTPLALTLRAARGGVAAAEVTLVQGDMRATAGRHEFSPGGPNDQRLDLSIDARALGLREGAAILEVRARDGFWRPLRVDDRPVLTVPITVDITPPVVEVLSATRYLAQGGGGIVVFRARAAARVGVNVGGIFFPAYPAGGPDADVLVSLVAVPYDFPTTSPVAVTAQDEAGNGTTRPVPLEIKPRVFPRDRIEISEAFLARKLPELLPGGEAAGADQLLAGFLVVNRDQRKAAETTRRQIAARTGPRPLWQGSFIQPRNSKVFSNFAETRTYVYKGKVVDTQVHFGYDLASLRNSPVPAANAGTVVWVGPLSIYGTVVVVDHGLGLQSLYAHMSSVDVKDGDRVTRGQILGRTGTTGLALGDHLHYEVLVHGISVTPLEWWDAKWIRDHIGKPLREAGVPLLESEQAGAPPPAAAGAPARRRSRAR
jgi:murein DD-endopeptidase MepM/ murein hydrolase activator NlpD